MVVKCIENFLKALDKKFSLQKWGFGQNIQISFFSSNFSKSKLFYFSCHRIWLACRMYIFFLLTQNTSLSGVFEYLERSHRVHKKFSGGSQRKSLTSKIKVSASMSQSHFQLWFFKIQTFSLRASGKLSMHPMTTFKVLK